MTTNQWLVCPTGLPLINRRCRRCPSGRYRTYGKFRVNANHKLLDVWLLALCSRCGETIKLTVLERVTVRAIDPSTLTRFHDNDPELAATVLADPAVLRRNNVSLDWDGAWTLRRERTDARAVDTSIRFVRRIPVRRTRLLSAGLEVPGREVRRLIAEGLLTSAHRLTGKSAGDFSFTLRRSAQRSRRLAGDQAAGEGLGS
ncbi:DUF1062 domain-containing protein [Actinoplanes sp. NPDC048988]|uniref:DUF1062 domain-containing protein n=1 Tax=Actinoplanes sp. NPDC048988 TaxID=3363901 RepID=UPI0037217095